MAQPVTITDADLRGLAGKVIVITGGSSGIGLETTKKFLGLGAKVVNGDFNPPRVKIDDDRLTFVPCDVTSWGQLSTLFEKTVRIHGRIDHVFANAGIGPSTDYLGENYDANGVLLEPSFHTIDVNLRGVINTVYLAMHHMKKQTTTSSIVISASASSFQRFRVIDYAIAKHGVLGLMRGLTNITYPALPIRVNAVAPDWTSTGIVNEEFVKVIEASGSGTQEPEVVARSVGLLMADGARHGQLLYSARGEFKEIDGLLLGNIPEICGTGTTLDEAVRQQQFLYAEAAAAEAATAQK